MSNTSTSDLIDRSTAKRQRTDDSGVVPGVPVEDTDGLRAVEKVVVENVTTTTKFALLPPPATVCKGEMDRRRGMLFEDFSKKTLCKMVEEKLPTDASRLHASVHGAQLFGRWVDVPAWALAKI
eukprot:1941544-Prymnesium_polylepis.1